MTQNTVDNTVTLSAAEFAKLVKSVQYRKEYNKRPEVVAKRRTYMSKRYEQGKVAREVFKTVQSDPVLSKQLLGHTFKA